MFNFFYRRLPSFFIVESIVLAICCSFLPLLDKPWRGEFKIYMIENLTLKYIVGAFLIVYLLCFFYWFFCLLMIIILNFDSTSIFDRRDRGFVDLFPIILPLRFNFNEPFQEFWFGKNSTLLYKLNTKETWEHSYIPQSIEFLNTKENWYQTWRPKSVHFYPIFENWRGFKRIFIFDVLPSWLFIILIISFMNYLNIWVLMSICIGGFFGFKNKLRKIQINRIKELGLLGMPIDAIRNEDLGIVVTYSDYISKKIVDDIPHLAIGQEFDVTLNNSPRNDKEKIQVQIRNPKTPMYHALVTEFYFEELHKAIIEAEKNNERFVVKLFEILPNGKLLLGLKFEKN